MSDYPTAEEEFELMYGDELEALQELEKDFNIVKAPAKTRRSLDFTHTEESLNSIPAVNSTHGTSFEVDFQPLPQSQLPSREREVVKPLSSKEPSKKRSIQELFGEIDDILSEEITEGNVKKRKSSQDDFDVIDHILELRQKARKLHNPISVLKESSGVNESEHYSNNISYCVPKYPFVTITNRHGKKVYIRCHSEQYEQEEINRIAKANSFAGVMGEGFKTIWNAAHLHLNKVLDKENEPVNADSAPTPAPVNISILKQSIENNTNLWVDLYKPQNYFELLSSENANRTLLYWLKLWDGIVFNRKRKLSITENTNNFHMTLDEHGRPKQTIVLLCGPPGSGKTTLAHMLAKKAGYNVVEVNASDDRSIESFKTILENATQMRSVIDRENRPNCIVFDEIDGAPSSSIEHLIKFATGSVKTKKKKGGALILKRPIICICNDMYVPALHHLRQIAFVINFPTIHSPRLAERLRDITRHQKIKADQRALLELCKKCGNDVRSCLSFLHFFKSLNREITLSQIYRSDVGQKDMQKGLFAVWNDILQIKPVNNNNNNKERNVEPNLKDRMQKILNTVNSFGDYERLAQGIFENYPDVVMENLDLKCITEALEWFCFTDVFNKEILSHQNYTLSSYIPYAFVVWHYYFARKTWQKLKYSNTGYEVRTKAQRNAALIQEVMKGMQPKVRAFVSPNSLKLDTLPILQRIITPAFRPINLHLYTEKERNDLNHLVSVMIDYNLNYVQERTPDGIYIFNLDPNLQEIAGFPGLRSPHTLSYSNKQLIARELEVEKMRRIEMSKTSSGVDSGAARTNTAKTSEKSPQLPNHMQKLKAKEVKSNKSEIVAKDFFGRLVTKTTETAGKIGPELSSDVWYQFKEGYSNAVRKKVKVSDLM